MPLLFDHDQRRALNDELHARPFAPLSAPAQILSLSFKPKSADLAAPERDRAALADLLSRFKASPPDRIGNHYVVELEGFRLRWERHTEFSTYTVTVSGAPERPFDTRAIDRLPASWLSEAPERLGGVISSTLVNVVPVDEVEHAEQVVRTDYAEHFVQESLAVAFLTDGEAAAMSDFRIDSNGHTRFAVLALPAIGPRRLGRITQRLIELDTYRTLAMLGLPLARELGPKLTKIDDELLDLSQLMARGADDDTTLRAAPVRASNADADRQTLARLTELSAELERLTAESAYRFSATRAYQKIVEERIAVLRESRMIQRQTFGEFMVRRFKPAMRTVESTQARLEALSSRAARKANLLSTRVGVFQAEQNQQLLHSMNRRAELQLRLQQTVEGLSVVAISYYAVSLAGYLLTPLAGLLGGEVKYWQAAAALPIIGGVYWMVQKIRKNAERG
ncbi:MAG: DUF3422 domain-containing protein [Pseudomonadota bacterium]